MFIKKRKLRGAIRWWHITVLAAAVLTVAGIVTYHYVSSKITNRQTYVDNWNQLAAMTSSSEAVSSDTSSAVSGVSTDVEGRNYPIIKKKQIDKNIENILIIGIDKGKKNQTADHRSDTMIVVSINSKTNKVKLTSIMRDIRAYFPDRHTWEKINASYSLGGPGYTVNIINYNFKLDIQKYVVVDFSGFKKIVDAAGGVDITLTKKETQQIKTLATKEAGTYHLDGAQALTYARIRHIDSDFFRVKRQKNVILSLFGKYKDLSLLQQTSLANVCLDYVKTNIPTSEIIGKVLTYSSKISSKIKQFTVPSAGNYTSVNRPVFYFRLNWYNQVNDLYHYIFNKNVSYFTAPTDASSHSSSSSKASKSSSRVSSVASTGNSSTASSHEESKPVSSSSPSKSGGSSDNSSSAVSGST